MIFTYTLRNSGGGTLNGTATAACDGFSVAPTTFHLDAGEQVGLVVTFAPPHAGGFNCQLAIQSDGGDLQRALSGTGAEAPAVPVVSSPGSPAGLAMVGLLTAGIGWFLRRRASRY